MSLLAQKFETRWGDFLLVASPRGICRICFPNTAPGQWNSWLQRWFGEVPRKGTRSVLTECAWQLAQYLRGDRTSFSVPLDLKGTPFQVSVWERVIRIPFGSTATYGELARDLGSPKGARAVGSANGSNPVPILVPCHRVIGSGGGLVGFGGGISMKERLLELEGVRIPFSREGSDGSRGDFQHSLAWDWSQAGLPI